MGRDIGDGFALDVFGVGAIAYHIITGRRPAAGDAELAKQLSQNGCLSVLNQADAIPDVLDRLVRRATAADPAHRTPDVAEFLLELDQAREELETTEEQQAVIDPLEAETGADLEGGFTVERRSGRGSTALALLVRKDNERAVLEVSLDPRKDVRLAAEAAALATIRGNPGVVELLSDGVIDVGPRRALLLSYAGSAAWPRNFANEGGCSLSGFRSGVMTCCRSSITFSVAASCTVTSNRTTWESPSVAARARSGSLCCSISRSLPSR